MTEQRDPFTAVDEVQAAGRKLRVYPLTLGDAPQVEKLMQAFNPEAMPLVFLYEDARAAAAQVVKLATRLDDEQIAAFTAADFETIIGAFTGLSRLKKKTAL